MRKSASDSLASRWRAPLRRFGLSLIAASVLAACGTLHPVRLTAGGVVPMPRARSLPPACRQQARMVGDGEIHKVEPIYPKRAVDDGVQGWAVVRFDIAEDGSVAHPAVVDSAPPGVFGGAALVAVKQWRFPRGPQENVCVRLSFALQ